MRKKKRRSTRERYFNLMLVPQSSSKVLSLKIPFLLPKCLLAGVIIFIVLSGYFVHCYYKLQNETEELKIFKDISNIQEERIQKLEKEAEAVRSKLGEVSNLDRQIREMVGLENPDTPQRHPEIPSRGGLRSRTSSRYRDIINVSINSNSNGEGGAEKSLPVIEQPDKLDNLEKKIQELDQELSEKKELLNRLKTDVQARLAYLRAFPSGWPVSGRFTSEFGYRQSPFGGRKEEFHDGLDIANRHGTPFRAAGAGTVVSAGWESGYGQMIIIDHGYGYKTYYAHCSQILVEVGQKVERGDVIGKIGSTGRTTGPHLHLSVTYRGEFINPREVLQ